MGGLGIGSLEATNLSLLIKWWWRFKTEEESLWKNVISSIHGVKGRLDRFDEVYLREGVWKGIIKSGELVNHHGLNITLCFRSKIFSGSKTRF